MFILSKNLRQHVFAGCEWSSCRSALDNMHLVGVYIAMLSYVPRQYAYSEVFVWSCCRRIFDNMTRTMRTNGRVVGEFETV